MTNRPPHPLVRALLTAESFLTAGTTGEKPPIAHICRRLGEGENLDPHRPRTAWHKGQRPKGEPGKLTVPEALRLAARFAEERGRPGDTERAENLTAAADQLERT